MLCDFRRVILPDPVTLNRFAAVLFVFSFAIFLFSGRLRLRDEHHDHQAPVHGRRALDGGDVGKLFGHRFELLPTQFRVRDFSRPELAGHLDLVAVFQELASFLRLEAEIMRRNSRTDLYTLYVLLFFLRLPLPVLHFVLIFAVIDDPANRRLSGGRNHHQVKTFLLGDVESLTGLQDSKLLSVGIDHPYITKAQAALID